MVGDLDLLSAQRSRFVGRSAELERLTRSLTQDHRLITVLGAPGVGKTRLLLEAVQNLDDRRNVRLCDVSRATSLGAVAVGVADALGSPRLGRNEEQLLADVDAELARRERTLLVLDGMDDAIAHAQGSLGRWLATAPGLRVVVSSRRRLGRSGEQLFELAPLTLADARALFFERASLVQDSSAGDLAANPRVDALLEAVDRVPLAIELCAMRLRLLPVDALLTKLTSDPLAVLVDESRRGRGQSMKDAIGRSVERLEPEQRATLRRLCGLDDDFSLDDAERVLGGAAPAMTALQVLRDHSLLAVEGDRYRFLQLVRHYVASNPAGETGGARALEVSADARRLRPPGGEWARLPARSPLRRILLGLLELHERSPKATLSLDELVERGWPDERIMPDAAKSRGYMALTRLRKLGLDSVLERLEDGYRLDPDLTVITTDDSDG